MGNDVTCRPYGEAGDYQTVAAWYAHHRGGEVFPEMVLPPHGVIATLDGVPTAALWVYLSYGIGVAHVHWAVGRPKAGFWVLRRAFRAAVGYIEDVCRAHDCRLIFANCLPAVARVLPRLGFKNAQPQVFMFKALIE